MDPFAAPKHLLSTLVCVSFALLALVGFLLAGSDAQAAGHARGAVASGPSASPSELAAVDTTVTISGRPLAPPVAPGFLGLSIEYPALAAYMGPDPSAVNPVFERLVRNLAPGAAPVLRIGGDSTDTTWLPAAGLSRPPGASYALDRAWLDGAAALVRAIHGTLILGLNLEARRPPVAHAEADAFLSTIGARFIAAFEPGNEPSQFARFPWYRLSDGQAVFARPLGYSFRAFERDFNRVVDRLPSRVPLAGPALAGRGWLRRLPRFLVHEPRVTIATDHAYSLNRCWSTPGSLRSPSVPQLLSLYASRSLPRAVRPYIVEAHRRGRQFRIDETQSVACGGQSGVSDAFASALWVLDTLFEWARVGADGVNVHTFPGAAYQLFTFTDPGGRWQAQVAPEYYGMLMFAQSVPPHARLLDLAQAGPSNVHVWATRGPDGTLRVVIINDDLSQAHTVQINAGPGYGPAGVIRLQAPSAYATDGVTWGGGSLQDTTTGRPPATASEAAPGDSSGEVVTLPATSAALVTIPAA